MDVIFKGPEMRWENNAFGIYEHKAIRVAHLLELAVTDGEGYPLASQRRLNPGQEMLLELSNIRRVPCELTMQVAEEIATANRKTQ